MATLLLSALGTAVGGPIGGAIGALIGRQADARLFGPARRGPRLRELAVSTSSYGQPVPRVFGRMRVPGAIIWASDIAERTSRGGGRKGQPAGASASYSASFAVAVSSTPIARVGRIWADGSLLRGAGGDLKVAGQVRVYHGHGDDPVDPLIAAAAAAAAASGAPAFRDFAYMVFEDLALGEFGNRVPALSFEVFAARDAAAVSLAALLPRPGPVRPGQALTPVRGLADEGGPLAATLAAIDEVIPLVCTADARGLSVRRRGADPAIARLLPERLPQANDEPGEGRYRQRAAAPLRAPAAIRYYDEERDYQPGLQRAVGMHPSGRERVVELPATITAAGAKQLANASATRARWTHETIAWRIAELDPRLMPGALVRVPETPGVWLVRAWEWFERGIELELERIPPPVFAAAASDPGPALIAADRIIPPTILHLIEVANDGSANPAAALVYAASSAQSSAWRGAALHLVAGEALVPLTHAAADRAVVGALAAPLGPSPALVFEPEATLEVLLGGDDLAFENADRRGLAMGANRLMIGAEVVQFALAEPLDAGRRWRLRGLLRGRAGTEPAAAAGHSTGTPAILLDERLTALDPAVVPPLASTRIAALGLGDADAVIAPLQNAGLSRRPPVPVHPRQQQLADGSWLLAWTRRARGQWRWLDLVEAPLVEERESYLVGLGPLAAPLASWTVDRPQFALPAPERAALFAAHGPASLWVQQIGTFAPSPALLLGPLAP